MARSGQARAPRCRAYIFHIVVSASCSSCLASGVYTEDQSAAPLFQLGRAGGTPQSCSELACLGFRCEVFCSLGGSRRLVTRASCRSRHCTMAGNTVRRIRYSYCTLGKVGPVTSSRASYSRFILIHGAITA